MERKQQKRLGCVFVELVLNSGKDHTKSSAMNNGNFSPSRLHTVCIAFYL